MNGPAIMNRLFRWMILTALAPLLALASEEVKLDPAPINSLDKISLQRGAHTFVNYCLNCHGAAYMRFSRLTDLGLSEQQIRDYLVLTGAKVGDTMAVALRKEDAVQWLGAPPPDLSVVARSRGVDWLYSYLRSYYRDDSRPTGWNNTVFENVGMPHVLYELQGINTVKVTETEQHGQKVQHKTLTLEAPGKLSPREYDQLVGDLVNFLGYMGEPARGTRTQLGIVVLFFLGLLFVLVLLLKKEYWKNIK